MGILGGRVGVGVIGPGSFGTWMRGLFMNFPRPVLRFKAAVLLATLVLGWPLPVAAQGLFVVSQANEKILKFDASDGSFLRS